MTNIEVVYENSAPFNAQLGQPNSSLGLFPFLFPVLQHALNTKENAKQWEGARPKIRKGESKQGWWYKLARTNKRHETRDRK